MADGRTGFDFPGLAHALLRAVAGLMVMQHGLQKLFGVLGGERVQQFVSLDGVAAPLETLGGLLVAIGLFTRPAAFLLSGEMAVAYFWRHAPRAFWPVLNRGEVAALLCFIFLYLAVVGGGRWSIDHLLARRRGRGARAGAGEAAV